MLDVSGMQVALLNVSNDSNRGTCALTWAAIELVLKAFPTAEIAIIPIAVTPPDPAPFRHTMKRYPRIRILPPLFDGQGKGTMALLWRLGYSLRELFHFDVAHPTPNPTLEWIRTSDLAVSVGGLTFQTYRGTFREDARLVVRTLPLLAAQKIGVPSVLLGTQVGPFRTRLGRRLFGRTAAKAAVVIARDQVSASIVDRLAKGGRSRPAPDSVFSLTPSPQGARAVFAGHDLDMTASTLALVISSALRSDERTDAHVALLAHVAGRLLESGFITQIVIVVQADEDRSISLALMRSLRLEARCLIDDDLDPERLSALYGACRAVISSRLHAVILGMLAGVPAISLAPEVTFKESAVLGMIGLESLCVPTRLGPARAAELCLAIASEETGYRRAVKTTVATAREQLEEVPVHLVDALRLSREGTDQTKLTVVPTGMAGSRAAGPTRHLP